MSTPYRKRKPFQKLSAGLLCPAGRGDVPAADLEQLSVNRRVHSRRGRWPVGSSGRVSRLQIHQPWMETSAFCPTLRPCG